MINLLLLYIISLVILLSTIGYGLYFIKVVNFKIKQFNLGLVGIFGLFFLSIISSYTHIFFPHNYLHNILIIILGLFFTFFFIKKSNLKIFIELKYILIIFSLIFICLIMSKTNEDFPYYHLPNSLQFAEQKLQFGLGNLNHGFKHISSIFMLMSLNYLPFFKVYLFNLSNFLFYFFLILFCLNEIFKKKQKILNANISQILISLILILFLTKFSRLAEYGSDIAAQIIIAIYIFYLFEILFNKKLNNNQKKLYYKISIILIIFAVTLKFILVIYSLFFISVLFFIKKDILHEILLSRFLIFIFSPVIIFIFFNYSSTGCLIYPIEKTCLNNFKWSLSNDLVQYMNFHYEIWAKGGKGPGFIVNDQESYVQSFNWISHWYHNYFLGKVTDYLLTTFLIIIIFSLFFLKEIKINKKNFLNFNKQYFIFYSFTIIIFLIWFLNFSTIRYAGYIIIYLLIIFPFIIYINKRVNLHDKLSFKKLSIIFLISFSVFLFKNISRLNSELNIPITNNHNFSNFPFYWLDEVNYEVKYISGYKVFLTKGMCWNIPSVCVRGVEGFQSYKKNGYIFYYTK